MAVKFQIHFNSSIKMEQKVESLTIIQIKKLDVYTDIPLYERKSTANKLKLVSLIIKYYDPNKHHLFDDRPVPMQSPSPIPISLTPKRGQVRLVMRKPPLKPTKMYNYLFSLLSNPNPDLFNDPSVGLTLIKYIREGEDPFVNLNISPNITFNIPITIFSILFNNNIAMINQYLKSIDFPIPDNFFILDKYTIGVYLEKAHSGRYILDKISRLER